MKSYLIVFFVSLSFVGFGQDSTNNCSQFRFANVEGGGLGYQYHFYNHFQDFFPAEKMTDNKIKSMKIIEKNNNKIRYHYWLDENGFVKNYQAKNKYNYQFFYTRKGEKILNRGHLFDNKRDTSWNRHSYTASSMRVHRKFVSLEALGDFEYFYDNKNRVIAYSNHNLHLHDTTFYIYDDVNYTFTDIETTRQDTILTKVWFNENWQPIRERYDENELMIFEGNYTYENDFLVKYEFYLLQLKPLEVDFDLNIFPNFNDLNNYEKKIHQTVFHYNTNGLLEKIIQTTDDGTCEYRVYYYTE